MSRERKRILMGDVSGIVTSPHPNVIRVYLSSVGPDTIEERNILMEKVYPAVREYCRSMYGLEFQMLDLKWGVDDEYYWPDHRLSEFITQQLTHTDSGVPSFFVSILGQRYGPLVAPRTICEKEYHHITRALRQHPGRETRNWPILERCYVLDENATPPVYTLRDIPHLQQNDRAVWQLTSQEIARLLRKGAEYCFIDGVFTPDILARYSSSDQRKEVEKAIEISNDFASESFHATRKIIDLKNYMNDDITPNYIELKVNKAEQIEIDDNSERMRNIVRQCIENRVDKEKTIINFEILWRYDGVVNPQHHHEYLDNFQSQFHYKLLAMIGSKIDKSHVCKSKSQDLRLLEIKQHWFRSRQLSAEFVGREGELSRLMKYLGDETNHPFIIHGESGVGKTMLLSRFALQTQCTVNKNRWTVLRFLGMTPTSLDMIQLLESLCLQIRELHGKSPIEPSTDIKELIRCFHATLNEVPANVTLILILDGMDEMNLECHSHSWLPMDIPQNVKMIISTHSHKYDVLKKLQNTFIGDCFLKLSDLDSQQSEDLLLTMIDRKSRNITDEQWNQIQLTVNSCGNPLFLSLLSNICIKLTSDINCRKLMLPNNLENMMKYFFEDLEHCFGRTLVGRAMSYIAASHGGLADYEMQDILSMDDDVIHELYRNETQKLSRIPPIIWLGLKHKLGILLFQYEVDGLTISNFAHSYVIDYVVDRYMCSSDDKKRTHSLLADFFLGKWHGVKKPLNTTQKKSHQTERTDRLVVSQPLSFDGHNHTVHFNKRKLSQVPRHLYRSENLEELIEMVLFNYKWMYNKTCALSLLAVIDDFQLYPCEETRLVEESLRASRQILERDISNMAVEITGRLLPYYKLHANVRSLIKQCDRDGLMHSSVVPMFSYATVPGSTHEHTIVASEQEIDSFAMYHNPRFILMKKKDNSRVYVCNLSTGQMSEKIPSSCGTLMVTPDGMFMVIVDHSTDKTIKIHLADSGKFVGQLIVMNYVEIIPKEKYRMGEVVISNDRLCVIVTADTSFLCIADISTCRFLQIVQLYHRADVCVFSTDHTLVYCNAAQYLLTYNVYTLEHVASTSLSHRPSIATPSRDDMRLFVANDIENKVSILHTYEGRTELTYKVVLTDILLNDSIVNMTMSNNDQMLLIRGKHNLIIYDRTNQNVITSFSRPSDVPLEFKLPRGLYTPLYFTQADFSSDDLHVFGAIFRNVYIWDIETSAMVSNIQTPVGIIDMLYINKRSPQIVTHCEHSNEVHTWNISKAVNKLEYPDSLTNSVTKIQISSNRQYGFVTCRDSDELGVINMNTGAYVDLLTHGGKVINFSPSADGKYVMVTLDTTKPNTTTRLWDLTNREVIKEFGNAPGICLSLKKSNTFILISQVNVHFNAPYHITQYKLTENEVEESSYLETIPHLLKSPFTTYNDEYLVILAAHDYERCTDVYCDPYVILIDLQNDGTKHMLSAETFTGVANVKTIIDVRCCVSDPLSVAIIYILDDRDSSSGYNYGFILMDIEQRMVKVLCEPFLHPGVSISDTLLFADNFQLCIDERSDIYTMNSGYLKSLANPLSTNPRMLVLNDSAVVYTKDCVMSVIRLVDDKVIARVNVHFPITAVALADDTRTVVIGCHDGSVVSYIIIDPDYDNVDEVLSTVESRKCDSSKDQKHWDKVGDDVNEYSRPPSAKGFADDADVTIDDELVKRPDNLLLKPRSSTCQVM